MEVFRRRVGEPEKAWSEAEGQSGLDKKKKEATEIVTSRARYKGAKTGTRARKGKSRPRVGLQRGGRG